MSKSFSALAIAILVLAASPAKASAAEVDPFQKCINSTEHDVCFGAMSTYEERLRNAKDIPTFCYLAVRYATLQAYDGAIQSSHSERQYARETLNLIVSKCSQPEKGIAQQVLQVMAR